MTTATHAKPCRFHREIQPGCSGCTPSIPQKYAVRYTDLIGRVHNKEMAARTLWREASTGRLRTLHLEVLPIATETQLSGAQVAREARKSAQ